MARGRKGRGDSRVPPSPRLAELFPNGIPTHVDPADTRGVLGWAPEAEIETDPEGTPEITE